MTRVPADDLRDRLDELLERAEAGEEFEITVDGRPVATLAPPHRRRWISGEGLAAVLATPAWTTGDGSPPSS